MTVVRSFGPVPDVDGYGHPINTRRDENIRQDNRAVKIEDDKLANARVEPLHHQVKRGTGTQQVLPLVTR